MKFKKKPVVIEALQWDGTLATIGAIREFMKPNYPLIPELDQVQYKKVSLIIRTLEGDHEAKVGDWIIKGIKGEFYPCKPDIFKKTYEPVETPND